MVAKFTLKKQYPNESQILNAVGEYLTLRQHFFFRVNNAPTHQDSPTGGFWRRPNKYSVAGVPDIIMIDNCGKFIGLEIKAHNGKQSPEQKLFEQNCKELGAEYYIIRSIDDLINIGL